jgi:hypothetical protein
MIFDTPEAAAESVWPKPLLRAKSADLEAIFGTEARETLSSGDPVADRRAREVVAIAMNERWTLQPKDSTTRELVIGNEVWPVPDPARERRARLVVRTPPREGRDPRPANRSK